MLTVWLLTTFHYWFNEIAINEQLLWSRDIWFTKEELSLQLIIMCQVIAGDKCELYLFFLSGLQVWRELCRMSVKHASVHAKWIIGRVIGTKMHKTAKVRVTRLVLDPYLLKVNLLTVCIHCWYYRKGRCRGCNTAYFSKIMSTCFLTLSHENTWMSAGGWGAAAVLIL